MGKYIRHGIGALVGALAASLVAWLAARGILVDPEQAQMVAELISLGLAEFIILFGAPAFAAFLSYSGVEKFLKRFPIIDIEGWVDRLWLKSEAKEPSAETRQLQGRRL